MHSRTSAALALAIAALALGACGGDDGGGGGGGDEDAVREVVTQLISSDPAACDNVTDDFLESVDATKAECEESAGEAPDPMPEIGEIAVDGNEATAIVTDQDRSTVELVKRDGDWLVDRLDVEEGAGNQDG